MSQIMRGRICRTLLTLVIAGAALPGMVAQGQTPGFSGKESSFYSYTRYDFSYAGRPCIVVIPKTVAPGRPWIWRARFFGHEPQTDVALLERGFHLVYIDVAGMFGSPQAVTLWDNFYTYLTGTHGLARKAVLEGMSRGGLIIFNWAARNPDKVCCIYADAPVCDFKSWPGGKGAGAGDAASWTQCLKAYGMTEEQALQAKCNPIDNLEPLARAGVPLLHVVGDADEVVPVAENTAIVEQRYRALGGSIQVIHKPGIGHHPHSLKDPALIVAFILAARQSRQDPSDLLAHWAERLEYVGVAVLEPGYHVWGSSPIVGPEGKTHLFVARWPVSAKFLPGWHTHCEIAHYVGPEPTGPFTFQDVALRGTGQDTWDRLAPHNPTIHQVGKQYVLLYIGNNGTDGFPANQRIGMAVADDLNGPWRRVGTDGLILSPPTEAKIWSYGSTVGVNNPAFLQRPDGQFYLYYKAMRKGDIRRMGVARARDLAGPYEHYESPLTSNETTIEDGYAFMYAGRICLLTTDNDHGRGYLWQSEDGIHFGRPTLGFETMDKYIDPQVLQKSPKYYGPGKFERPQLLVREGQPTHLYVASGVNIQGGDGSCSYVLRIREQ